MYIYIICIFSSKYDPPATGGQIAGDRRISTNWASIRASKAIKP